MQRIIKGGRYDRTTCMAGGRGNVNLNAIAREKVTVVWGVAFGLWLLVGQWPAGRFDAGYRRYFTPGLAPLSALQAGGFNVMSNTYGSNNYTKIRVAAACRI